jgi:[ribosomal protein S18]-alanine N-acetyltransferase
VNPVVIRSATPADLDAIASIQAGCPEAAQWRPSDYLLNNCIVAVFEGTVVGFLAARRNGPAEREILNLAIDPRYRRRGFAARLVRWQVEAHPGQYFLEVRESNRPARRLYSQLGFEEAGKRPNYYTDPIEGAIVMRFFS